MTLTVVPGPQVRVGQPIVSDVDPFRELLGGRTGDVGMMLFQECAPGDLDRLERGVDRQLESGVEVVGREHRSRRHRDSSYRPMAAAARERA